MKKKSKYLIIVLLVIFITSLIIKINPNQFYPSENQVRDEWAGSVIETPQLSYAPNWTLNGVEICTESNDQEKPQMISDGAGGAIITWVDNRSGSLDIWAQKIDSNGEPEWDYGGKPVTLAAFRQYHPRICSDGSGGAIIAWRDARNGKAEIYAQRIDFNGNRWWTANGIAINTVSYDIAEDFDLEMCSDGFGGAIITWLDTRLPVPMYKYAQRINTSGVVQWATNGIQVDSDDNSFTPQICSDGAGGAIIVWLDLSQHIYAQRLSSSNGIKLWNIGGEAICTGRRASQPEVISDGAGGAIITWHGGKYAQLINSTGNTQWITDGEVICEEGPQADQQICSDGAGGAIITWVDNRGGNSDIYAQLINSTGNTQWITDGEVICAASYEQVDPQICRDGAGGAIITWEDFRSGVFDIYTQRINSGGNIKWTTDGVAICKASYSQKDPQICIDGSGGAIITWQDYRSNTDYDIYAQRIKNDIPTSSHPGDFITDEDGSETIDWTLYDDCGVGQYRIWANNTVGNSYVWVDWTSWKNNTLIIVPINRTARGVYNYTIEYYDDQNQFGIPNTVIVTITDLLGPIITINSPIINDLYGDSPPNFNVIIFDLSGIDSMWYGIIGKSMNVVFTSNGSIESTLWNTVGNGLITIRFYANDTFGNQNHRDVVVEKDTIAPIIVINSPNPNDEFGTTSPAYDISINEPHLDQIWYTLDGGITNISITFLSGSIVQTVWDGVSLGAVTITFYANDTLGNIRFMSVGVIKIIEPSEPPNLLGTIATVLSIIGGTFTVLGILYRTVYTGKVKPKKWAKKLKSSRDEKIRFHAASKLKKSKSTNSTVISALKKVANDSSEKTEIRNLAKEALKERGIL